MYTPRLVPYRCSVPPPTFTSWSSSASNRPQIFHTATAKRLSPGVGTGSSTVSAERTRPGPTAWTIYWPECPTNRPGSCGAWGAEDGRGRPTKKSDNCCTGITALHCPTRSLSDRTQAPLEEDAGVRRRAFPTWKRHRRPRAEAAAQRGRAGVCARICGTSATDRRCVQGMHWRRWPWTAVRRVCVVGFPARARAALPHPCAGGLGRRRDSPAGGQWQGADRPVPRALKPAEGREGGWRGRRQCPRRLLARTLKLFLLVRGQESLCPQCGSSSTRPRRLGTRAASRTPTPALPSPRLQRSALPQLQPGAVAHGQRTASCRARSYFSWVLAIATSCTLIWVSASSYRSSHSFCFAWFRSRLSFSCSTLPSSLPQLQPGAVHSRPAHSSRCDADPPVQNIGYVQAQPLSRRRRRSTPSQALPLYFPPAAPPKRSALPQLQPGPAPGQRPAGDDGGGEGEHQRGG